MLNFYVPDRTRLGRSAVRGRRAVPIIDRFRIVAISRSVAAIGQIRTVRHWVVGSSQWDVAATVDLLIINIVPVIAVGLQAESRAANVALEAAVVEELPILQRAHLVSRVDEFSAAETSFLDHIFSSRSALASTSQNPAAG